MISIIIVKNKRFWFAVDDLTTKSLETASFFPLKSLRHSMSPDLQHINTTVLMGIVGPSQSVVISYMNQTWCWIPAITVLTLSWDLRSCAAQLISWLYGTTPAGLQSLLLVLSISCASRRAQAPIIQQWVCRFVVTDAGRQTEVWISFFWPGFETCFPSSAFLISLYLLVCSEQRWQRGN